MIETLHYIYIPLGGNRKGNIRYSFNIMLTFLVSGLWHGANWTFLMWGGIHGILNILQKFLNKNKMHIHLKKKKVVNHIYLIICNIFTDIVVFIL